MVRGRAAYSSAPSEAGVFGGNAVRSAEHRDLGDELGGGLDEWAGPKRRGRRRPFARGGADLVGEIRDQIRAPRSSRCPIAGRPRSALGTAGSHCRGPMPAVCPPVAIETPVQDRRGIPRQCRVHASERPRSSFWMGSSPLAAMMARCLRSAGQAGFSVRPA